MHLALVFHFQVFIGERVDVETAMGANSVFGSFENFMNKSVSCEAPSLDVDFTVKRPPAFPV